MTRTKPSAVAYEIRITGYMTLHSQGNKQLLAYEASADNTERQNL